MPEPVAGCGAPRAAHGTHLSSSPLHTTLHGPPSRAPLSASSSLLLCAEDADDIAASWHAAAVPADEWALPLPDPASSGDAVEADRHVCSLLAAEAEHMPRPDYLARFRDRSVDAAGRQDAVNWILKVSEVHRFRPVTACLAVNYLDRFLSSHSLPAVEKSGGGGWQMQLLSVASVSVAAKMEETRVPPPLGLQILGARFVFEPRTVRRMELLLAAALRWRARAVTPFDFLPYFTSSPARALNLLPRAAQLVLRTHRVVDFLGFRPSAIAAAALLCAAGDYSAEDSGAALGCFDKWVSKETVSGCRHLMEEHLIDTCPLSALRAKKPGPEPPPPRSPVGVLDAAACGSCDTTQKASAPATPVPEPALDAPPLPPPKRRRLTESRSMETEETGGGDGPNMAIK